MPAAPITAAKQAARLFPLALVRSWKPYDALLTQLASLEQLPERPKVWLREPGWVRYSPNEPPQKVEYPLEDALVYDIEKLFKISDSPTLATAVTPKAWYGWCSKYICGSSDPKDMIVLNPENKEKVVVGFNVGYDLVSVIDQYSFTQTCKTKWIDLLAWYVAAFSTYIPQRDTEKVNFERHIDEFFLPGMSPRLLNKPFTPFIYGQRTLAALHERHVGKALDKDVRRVFYSTSKDGVIDDFQNSMDYCSKDVSATFELFKVFYKKSTNKIHPIHLAGISELLNSKLFVNRAQWQKFINDSETKVKELDKEINKIKRKFSEIDDDPTFTRLKVTQAQFSHKLNVSYKGHPVIKAPDSGKLVQHLPNGELVDIPNEKPGTYSLLQAAHEEFWELGHFTANDDVTKTVVSSTLNTRFWTKNKKFLEEQTYIPVTETIDCLVPMVRPCFDQTWRPHHPFWLNHIPRGSVGEDFEKTFEFPPGLTKVGMKLDYEWIKDPVKTQENAIKVSPYLLRSAYDRCKIMVLSHIVLGCPEMFERNSISGFQLLTTFNKEIAYLVKDSDVEKASACIELVVLLVEKSAREQLKSKLPEQLITRIKEVESRCDHLGIELPDLTSNAFWVFTKTHGLQQYFQARHFKPKPNP